MSDTPPPAPAPNATPTSTSDDKTIAILTHLSGIVFGFIVPLVVWLIKKDSSAFLSDHAKEALNFQITVLIGFLGSFVLTFVAIGLLLMPLVWLANIVFCIVAAIKVSNGEAYRYPVALRLVS